MSASGCPPARIRRRTLLAGAALAAIPGLARAEAGAAAPAADRRIDAAFSDKLQERLLLDGVGFAAAQVDAQGVRLATLGVMRQGSPAPVTAQTLFELGSMTKAFVALLLADAVLAKRASFDDPIEADLPDGLKLRDAQGEPLRLIDLATHRSGLPRMPTNVSRKEREDPYPFYTEQRLFDFLRQWKPAVARGERFEYSNLGYGLLAQILARREGRSLDAVLAQRIFAPLGLSDLFIRRPLTGGDDLAALGAAVSASLATAPREATGHGPARQPERAWQFDAMAGAVGLVGSIVPVGRFMQAALGLFDHPLQPAFALCLQQRTEGEHPLHPFGLAWEMSPIVTRSSQRMLFNQDGATAGFSSSLWLEPARRRGAVVLANAFIETRELALAGLDPGIGVDSFSRMQLAPEQLAPLVGSYVLDARYKLDLRSRNGRLWAQGTGQQEFELLPSAPRRFFTRHSSLEVQFDDGERPARLLVLRDGKGLPFTRQP